MDDMWKNVSISVCDTFYKYGGLWCTLEEKKTIDVQTPFSFVLWELLDMLDKLLKLNYYIDYYPNLKWNLDFKTSNVFAQFISALWGFSNLQIN